MKQYNKTLDFVALALNASSKGKHTLAAKLFMKATAQPDFDQAIAVIEASNAQAFAAQKKAAVEAAKKEVKAAPKKVAPAAKRLAASAPGVRHVKAAEATQDLAAPEVDEPTLEAEDDVDLELGADLVSDEALEEEIPQEELAGDLDELDEPAEDPIEEEEVDDVGDDEVEEEDPADAFAAVLASMATKAKAPAKK